MDIKKMLQQLNISKNEAKVYVALIELGFTPVGPIVSKTKLHRMMVYQALENLKDARMASMVKKGGKQHWQASNPSILLEKVKKQEAIAIAAVEELQAMGNGSEDELNVQILYGRSGFIENLEDLINSAARTDKTMRIIGGAYDNDFYDLIGDWYNEYAKLQEKHKLRKYLLAPKGYSKKFEKHFFKEKGSECHEVDVNFSSPSFTRITKEIASIEVYGTKQPVVIQIKNPAIAAAYIERFDVLWKDAKKRD